MSTIRTNYGGLQENKVVNTLFNDIRNNNKKRSNLITTKQFKQNEIDFIAQQYGGINNKYRLNTNEYDLYQSTTMPNKSSCENTAKKWLKRYNTFPLAPQMKQSPTIKNNEIEISNMIPKKKKNYLIFIKFKITFKP